MWTSCRLRQFLRRKTFVWSVRWCLFLQEIQQVNKWASSKRSKIQVSIVMIIVNSKKKIPLIFTQCQSCYLSTAVFKFFLVTWLTSLIVTRHLATTQARPSWPSFGRFPCLCDRTKAEASRLWLSLCLVIETRKQINSINFVSRPPHPSLIPVCVDWQKMCISWSLIRLARDSPEKLVFLVILHLFVQLYMSQPGQPYSL